jgi:hypothetical protein
MAVRSSALCFSRGGGGADHVSVTFIFPNNAAIIYPKKKKVKALCYPENVDWDYTFHYKCNINF